MSFALGQGSYIGVVQQAGPTGWGGTAVNTGYKTFPNLGGTVLSPVAGWAPRKSIASTFPKGSQLYQTVSLVPVSFSFEVVTDPTAYKPLLVAAWGKRVRSGTNPNNVDTYTVTSPKFDAAADSDPTFYDHTLTYHVILSDGTTVVDKFSVKDVIITSFKWSAENNSTTTMAFEGTGRNLAASGIGSPAFTDQAGTLLSWGYAANSSPAGLYMDTNTTPSTLWKVRKFDFTLSQPHTFETGLGATSGGEMFTPFRTSPPTAVLNWETFYEDVTGKDPVQNMADYIAGTRQGAIINYRVDAQNYVKLNGAGSVDPAIVNSPKIDFGSQGAVTFGASLEIFPDTITDLYMELGSSSAT